MKDYYRILQVERSASDEEIKKSYRSLAKKFHPDVNAGNEKAEAVFKEVSEAYEILKDETKKANYDKKLKDKEFFQNKGTGKNTENATRTGASYTKVSPEDFMKSNGIFESFFGFSPKGSESHFDSKDEKIKPMKSTDAFEHIFGKKHF